MEGVGVELNKNKEDPKILLTYMLIKNNLEKEYLARNVTHLWTVLVLGQVGY